MHNLVFKRKLYLSIHIYVPVMLMLNWKEIPATMLELTIKKMHTLNVFELFEICGQASFLDLEGILKPLLFISCILIMCECKDGFH